VDVKLGLSPPGKNIQGGCLQRMFWHKKVEVIVGRWKSYNQDCLFT